MCVQWNIYLFVIAHCCGNSGCRGNQLLLKRKRKTMYSCPVMSMTCDEIILSLSKQINDYLIALPPLADNEAMATCVFGSLVLIVCHCSTDVISQFTASHYGSLIVCNTYHFG